MIFLNFTTLIEIRKLPKQTTMKILIRKNVYHRCGYLNHTRHFHNDTDSIVIASAVRTPWVQRMSQQYPSVTCNHLSAAVVEAAVKQSGAPVEKIQKVFMAESPVDNTLELNNLRFGELLKKAKHISITQGVTLGMKSLLMAIEDLKSKASEMVVVGRVDVASELQHKQPNQSSEQSYGNKSQLIEDFVSLCKERQLKAFQEGIFDAELLALKVIKQDGNKRLQVEITQDGVLDLSEQNMDGAVALVLTTMTTAQKYNIRPLVVIKDIVQLENANKNELQATQDVILTMVNKNGVPLSAIHHWEFNAKYSLVFDLQKHFHITWEHINPYGGISLSRETIQDYQIGIISHIAHTLKHNEHACLVSSDSVNSTAILFKKLPIFTSSNCLPHLTLFTKNPCHLCDILLDELQSTFEGEYELEKLYIDAKENVRYLRLYRHDIPVLYLNGQFLCMHRLNVRLLRRKLDLLKKQETV